MGSAEKYRAFVERAPIGMFETTLDGRILYVNDAIVQMMEFESAEAMQRENVRERYADDSERDAVVARLRKYGEVRNVLLRVSTAAKNPRDCLLSAVLEGDVLRGFIVDVTEAERTARELRRSEELNRRIMEAMPGGIVNVACDGAVVSANLEAQRILGLSYDELTSRYAADFDTDTLFEDGSPCSVEDYPVTKTLTTGEAQPACTIGVRKPDGEISWAIFTSVPVTDGRTGELTGAVVTFLDITARKLAEDRLRRLESQMQRTQKLESLGVLAGGIAHDFNNLLTVIIGNAALAKGGLPEGSSGLEDLARVEEAANRAAHLTNQMLAYSGKGKFVVEPVNLSELVREMLELLGATTGRARLLTDLDPGLPSVSADEAQLRQVVMNLLTNAAEAVSASGGVISVATGLCDLSRDALRETFLDDGLSPGSYVFLSVSDTGVGMDEATRARAFDPFFSTKAAGRGLGLSSTLGIVRGHEGAVRVDSQPGDGTTFTVYLPCREEAADRVAPAPLKLDAPQAASVLVIDDEPLVLSTIARMLQPLGFQTFTANGGELGLAMVRQRRSDIDVVLLDLTMPGMNGEDVLEALEQDGCGIPVVLMSGFSEQEVRGRVHEARVRGFLHKPFSPSDLLDRLSEAIRTGR